MALLLSCCRCIAIFGVLFYIAMGFIILGQVQFLRFEPVDKGSSIGACFVTAAIYLILIGACTLYERRQAAASITQQNYVNFDNQQRPRQSTFKGIAMVDLKALKEDDSPRQQIQRDQNMAL